MGTAKAIAEEIYQVYASGKNGILLEMEHKQEWEPVEELLRKEYFRSKVVIVVKYGEREYGGKYDYLPTIYECRWELREIRDEELYNARSASYLALALRKYAVKDSVGMIVIENFHLLPDEMMTQAARELLHIINVGKEVSNALILLTASPTDRVASDFWSGKLKQIPEELKSYLYTIRGRKPDNRELLEVTGETLQRMNLQLSENFKREIVSYLQGFQKYEVSYLLHRVALLYGEEVFREENKENEKKVLDLISSEKVKLLEKGQLLEWKMVLPMELANMEELKQHLRDSGMIMGQIEEAVENGIEVPKGILIMGLPGTGKSMFAQFAASDLHMPLVRLDMGKMMGGHVGDSERNLRNAQRQAEDLAPCILWIDEIEKGFAGSDGAREEGAYLRRMTGSFLTWLQEKKSSCYIIATANNIDGMSPEFFRKGRFDACFYTAMPSETELCNIIKVHLRKSGRSHVMPKAEEAILDVLRMAAGGERFLTGADASALVSNTFRRLYINFYKQNQQKTPDFSEKIDYDLEHFKDVFVAEFDKMRVFSETNGKDIAKFYEALERANFISVSSKEEDGRGGEDVRTNYDRRLKQFIEWKRSELKK